MPATPFLEPAALPFPLPKLRARSLLDSFRADAAGKTPAGWAVTGGTGTFHASGSGLALSAPNSFTSLIATGPSWKDAMVEARFTPLSTSNIGICVRADAAGANFYQMNVYLLGMQLWQRVNGTGFQIGSTLNGLVTAGVPCVFRLSVVGNALRGYLNGSQIFGFTGSAIAGPGSVGVIEYTASGETCDYFRAVQL